MAKEHVFVGAHAHVADWPDRFWHSGIAEKHSSQGLCVSFWGTLANDRRRSAIVDAIFSAAGLNLARVTATTITCEAGADGRLAPLLNETGGNTTPTCVDALIEWQRGVVCVESKFTEPSFGTCGQVAARWDTPPGAEPGTKVAVPPACTGRYGEGSDQKTLSRAPCRLQVWDGTRAPRLYWQIGWDIFRPEVLEPNGRLCPFAGPSFQLMRNLALACAAAAPRSRRPQRDRPPETVRRDWALLVIDVGKNPHAETHRAEIRRFRDLLLDEVRGRVGLVTYEQVVPILRAHDRHELADEVERRLTIT